MQHSVECLQICSRKNVMLYSTTYMPSGRATISNSICCGSNRYMQMQPVFAGQQDKLKLSRAQ